MSQQSLDVCVEALVPMSTGPHHTVLPGLWSLPQFSQKCLQLLWPLGVHQLLAVDDLSRQTEETLKLLPGPLYGEGAVRSQVGAQVCS